MDRPHRTRPSGASLVACVLGALWMCAATGGAPSDAPVPQVAPARPVRVAVFADPPFAMRDPSGRWDGYAAVLLQAAAVQSQLVLEFRECASLDELYEDVATGRADVGLGNTLVTSARLAALAYTQPILDGGLRVMVPGDHAHTLRRLWDGMEADGHVRVLLWGAAITVGASLVLVAVLRRVDREFTRHWHEGFAEAFYHVASVTMTGKTSYKGKVGPRWAASLVAALWLVFGVASVAYLTSSLTSVMTANTMKSRIGGPHDLKDRTVGVLEGSVAARYCAQHGIHVVPFASLDAAAAQLASKRLDAVVADAQSLDYFHVSHPEVSVAVVGEVFERRHFAFPVRPGDDELLRRLDVAIVSMREDGVLDRVRGRWFGH